MCRIFYRIFKCLILALDDLSKACNVLTFLSVPPLLRAIYTYLVCPSFSRLHDNHTSQSIIGSRYWATIMFRQACTEANCNKIYIAQIETNVTSESLTCDDLRFVKFQEIFLLSAAPS